MLFPFRSSAPRRDPLARAVGVRRLTSLPPDLFAPLLIEVLSSGVTCSETSSRAVMSISTCVCVRFSTFSPFTCEMSSLLFKPAAAAGPFASTL